MSRIRPDELANTPADTQPFILDIRPAADYRAGHIDGSHSLPVYDDLRSGDEESFRAGLDEIPRDRTVVTVCKMGIVAKRATRLLEDEGYEAVTLAGGMSGWRGYQKNSLGYRIRRFLWRFV